MSMLSEEYSLKQKFLVEATTNSISTFVLAWYPNNVHQERAEFSLLQVRIYLAAAQDGINFASRVKN